MQEMTSPVPTPRLTVIVATYNRPGPLDACLEALAAQDLPRDDFEVLVVDDGSAAPLRDLVGRWSTQLQVRLIEQANAGPACARNAGAQQARGRLLAFTDDDCRPDPGWLRALETACDAHPRALVGGSVACGLDNLYSAASQYLVEFLYGFFGRHYPEQRFFVTANCAAPADLFHAVGRFDVSFPFAAAEDRDLCDRWQERGFDLHYAEDARVVHAHVLTPRTFWRQHFTYGRGGWFLEKARAARGGRRPPVRLHLLYPELAQFAFTKRRGLTGVALLALLLVSQLGYSVGYIWQSKAAPPRRAGVPSAS